MDINASGDKDTMTRDFAVRLQDSPTRHSPAPPLAPLEYLQNQRRGSITDPSLHAATPNHQSQTLGSSALNDTQSKNVPHTARPTSPYIFGDASAHLSDSSNPHTRRQMQIPTSERVNALSSSANASADSHKGQDGSGKMTQVHNGQNAKHSQSDEMETDLPETTSHRKPAIELVTTSANSDAVTFDYNMRRHSLGGEPARPSSVGQSRASPVSPASQAGSKRKMSSDRSALPSVGEEIDPQLTGPGTHSAAPTESDEPAPKRRSSAFDTRIAQLSLYDRRDSIDSRMSGTSTWWGNDRRDSTSSILSNTSLPSGVAGYNPPAFAGDSVRPPGSMTAFAWPPNNGPGDPNAAQASAHGEPVDPNVGRQLDAHIPPHSTAPPSGIPFDRRMSVPDTMPSTTTTRPERLLRSRSRPPSRSTRGVDVSSATTQDTQQLLVSTSADDSPTSSSPTATTSQTPQKESGATPYSRSPELRVSHKLAERKRRKEMRDLFDELRDQLPADRGMKASKWEILSKAIDFIQQMKQSHADMAREIEVLRHELDAVRHGVAFGHPGHPGPPHAVVYGHPPPVAAAYPPPGPQPQAPSSRPGSSQNTFAANPGAPSTNGKSQPPPM